MNCAVDHQCLNPSRSKKSTTPKQDLKYLCDLPISGSEGQGLKNTEDLKQQCDRNQGADQRFSLKQWFTAGAHYYRLRETGSAHCNLMISEKYHYTVSSAKEHFQS